MNTLTSLSDLLTPKRKKNFVDVYEKQLSERMGDAWWKQSILLDFKKSLEWPSYVLNHSSEKCEHEGVCLFRALTGDRWSNSRSTVTLEGRDIIAILPGCREQAEWGWYKYLAAALAKDLKFELVAVKGWGDHIQTPYGYGNEDEYVFETFLDISKRMDREPFHDNDLLEAGVKPLVQTERSSYWIKDEVEKFASTRLKKRPQLSGLFHERVVRSWSQKEQDTYLFDYQKPVENFPCGLLKPGISIHVRQRFSGGAPSIGEEKAELKALVPKGGRKLEKEFERVFGAYRISPDVVRQLGIIDAPTEWYDGRIRDEALDFFASKGSKID